ARRRESTQRPAGLSCRLDDRCPRGSWYRPQSCRHGSSSSEPPVTRPWLERTGLPQCKARSGEEQNRALVSPENGSANRSCQRSRYSFPSRSRLRRSRNQAKRRRKRKIKIRKRSKRKIRRKSKIARAAATRANWSPTLNLAPALDPLPNLNLHLTLSHL